MQKFFLGLVLGAVVMGATVWVVMPSLMLQVHESKLGFDETVTAIEKSYKENNWKIQKSVSGVLLISRRPCRAQVTLT